MRNKSNSAFFIYIFSICMFLLCTSQLIAQENGFYELTENSSENRTEFYGLALNLHPTAYVENSDIKIGGNGGYDNLPIKKLTFNDVKSFNILNNNNNQLNKVELMTIKLLTTGDFNSRINLSEVNGLNRLKYVLIECTFDCTESQIKEFITYEEDSNIRIFYKVNKPS